MAGKFGMNWLKRIAQMKLLIIVRGPSGSGKSMLVKKKQKEYGVPDDLVFSTDKFWINEETGQYNFSKDYLPDAHLWNKSVTDRAMQGGPPVIIVDNTNTRLVEMKPYVQMAQKYGYEVKFIESDWAKTPEGQWDISVLEKVQNQSDRQEIGKVVPVEILEQMVGQYEYNPTVENVLRSEKTQL